MSFNLKDKLTTAYQNWPSRMLRTGVQSTYAFMAAVALWPLAQAMQAGDGSAWMELGQFTAGIGTYLLANLLQASKDEADVAAQIADLPVDALVRAEIDAVLDKTDAVIHARESLPEVQREGFTKTLQAELQQLGTLPRFQASLIGGGAIAQGDGAVAVEQGGVHIGGNNQGNINSGVQIVNNQYAGPTPQNPAEVQRIYLEVMAFMASYLPLGAFDPNSSNPNAPDRRLQLEDVFIRLDTTAQVRKEPDEPEPTTLVGRLKRKLTGMTQAVQERVQGAGATYDETRPLRAMEAAGRNRWLVITGEPGSGKSTLLNFLVHCLACNAADYPSNLPEQFTGDWPAAQRDLIPVRVILRDFETWLREQPLNEMGPSLLRNFIAHTLRQQNLAFADDWLGQRIEAGKAVVVLDGLDEVTTIASRVRVRDAMAAFALRHRNNRYLVTCRTLAYQPPEAMEDADLRLTVNDFPSFELAGLDDEKIKDFVEAWHMELARSGKFNQVRAETLQRKLWDALQVSTLKDLARNPLQLTLMAWVHTDNDELPDKRARLYFKAVELLLWKWELQKQYRDNRQTLGELAQQVSNGRRAIEGELRRAAYKAHLAMSGAQVKAAATLADVDEASLRSGLAALKRDPLTYRPDENWARDVVDAIKERSGLLARRGENKLTFPHRTFQEYLAGLHLLDDRNFVDVAVEMSVDLTQWREPILLAVGYSVYQQDRTDLALPILLAHRLCLPCTDDELHWKRVWLAGEVLCEINPDDAQKKDRAIYKEVQELVTQLVIGGHLKPTERARVGSILARLGDPRFDPDQWYLPNQDELSLGFIEVLSGPFNMGINRSDRNALLKKKHSSLSTVSLESLERESWLTSHPLHLDSFFIARYPTTVAQFRTFVQHTNWTVSSPECLNDDDNRPVRWINWQDAMAYCNWLTEELRNSSSIPWRLRVALHNEGWIVRLPSEAEWEKAARGASLFLATNSTDKQQTSNRRLFPWGKLENEDQNSNFGNTSLCGIHSTSAVGAFPNGRSPYSCLDMAGNVWEWTASEYRSYPYNINDGREDRNLAGSRVLRGGAWTDDIHNARCTYRYRPRPDLRTNNIGFRTVIGSP